MFLALSEVGLLLLFILLPIFFLPKKKTHGAIYKVRIKEESRYMVNAQGELEEMKNAG